METTAYAARIPDEEWNRYYDDLKSLYLGDRDKDMKPQTLKNIAAVMKTKGFTASESQFEAQFKKWGFRKNLKSEDWEPIFRRLDRIPPGTEYRVSISGRVKTKRSIERAERYVKKPRTAGGTPRREDEATSVLPAHVCIEVQGDDGNWSQIMDKTPTVDADSPSPSASNQIQGVQSHLQDGQATYPISPFIHGASPLGVQLLSLGRSIDNFDFQFPQVMDLMGSSTQEWLDLTLGGANQFESMQLALLDSQVTHFTSCPINRAVPALREPQQLHWDDNVDNFDNQILQQMELMLSPPSEWPGDPPSSLLTNAMGVIGLNLTRKSIHGRVNPMRLYRAIHEHVNIGASHALQHMSRVTPIHILEILLSTSASQNMPADGLLNPHLAQFLRSAMLNAFSDSTDIPISLLAEITISDKILISCISRYLKNSQMNPATIIAPHVFHAAVWAGRSKVVAEFLEEKLMDVNYPLAIPADSRLRSHKGLSIGFYFEDDKCMPVEAATTNGDVETIEILIRHGAKIRAHVLFCLWVHCIEGTEPDDANLTSKSIIIGNILIKAGATVDVKLLDYLLCGDGSAQTPFIQLMVSNFPLSAHHQLFGDDGFGRARLPEIIEETGFEFFNRALSDCKARHSGLCIEQSKHIQSVFREAILEGRFDVFEAIFPHFKNSSDNEMLLFAIRGGSKSIISHIMAQRPDIGMGYQSPLVEAMKAKNQDLSDVLVASGILDVIQNGREFEDAVVAAVENGYVEIARTLVSRYANLEDYDINKIMLRVPEGAVLDSISSILTDAGVHVATHQCRSLKEALKQHHKGCVEPYLDQHYDSNEANQIIWEALEWGDRGIVHDILLSRTNEEQNNMILATLHWEEHTIIQEILSTYYFSTRLDPLTANDVFVYTPEEWDDVSRYHEDTDPIRRIEGCIIRFNNRKSLRSLTLWNLLDVKDKVELICDSKLATAGVLDTCLLMAILRRDQEMVLRFVQAGANPLNKAIWYAAAKHIPKSLIALGQEASVPGLVITRGLRTDLLVSAIEQGPSAFEAVSSLIDFGAIDISDCGWIVTPEDEWYGSSPGATLTPLGAAISQYDESPQFSYEVTRLLLDAGCNPNDIVERPNARFQPNQTALLKAIEIWDGKQLVELLLNRNARLNDDLSHNVWRTPLQKAVEEGDLEIIRLLIKEKAGINALPARRNGGTALQLAAISGDCEVAKELFAGGALLYAEPSEFNGRWPIEGAAEHGNLDMIQLLWNAKSEIIWLQEPGRHPGFEEKELRKAMKLATDNGHIGCRALIEELSGLEYKSPLPWPSQKTICVDWPPPGWSVD
ncbi:hypothetical protein F5Y10DRAFT_288234 [Nemania abortiva]|nr:hypothetical protein F5Y10DRAFT_288234 [Nemania abortiva]